MHGDVRKPRGGFSSTQTPMPMPTRRNQKRRIERRRQGALSRLVAAFVRPTKKYDEKARQRMTLEIRTLAQRLGVPVPTIK